MKATEIRINEPLALTMFVIVTLLHIWSRVAWYVSLLFGIGLILLFFSPTAIYQKVEVIADSTSD